MSSNFDVAVKAEQKKCTRHFQSYTGEQRANHAASHRLGHQQRHRVGEFFWTHPDFPNVAFKTRARAVRAAMSNTEAKP